LNCHNENTQDSIHYNENLISHIEDKCTNNKDVTNNVNNSFSIINSSLLDGIGSLCQLCNPSSVVAE